MKPSLRRFLFFALGAFLCGCTPTPPDLLLVNGRIWTAQDKSTFVEAVAIRNKLIERTGTSDELQKLAGPDTRVIDLNGKLVIPGFNDAHIHFLGGSMGLAEVDLSEARSGSAIVEAVTAFAQQHPEKKWITGRGWQYTWFPSGLPTGADLAGMPNDRPVLLTAYDGHSSWANTKALEMAGITDQSTPSGYGNIVRDAKGNATGALLEDAQSMIRKFIPESTREERLNALREGLRLAARLGITSMQNASGSLDELSLYLELQKNNELTARYSAALSVDENTPDSVIETFKAKREELSHNPLVHADAIKFMLDGVIESHTAAMLLPYDDDLDQVGDFAHPIGDYRRKVLALDKAGFRLYTHAIGDRAVREALNAYEAAQRENNPRPRRHRIEHIETISPEDIPRFASLGVLASMEPIHADPGTMGVWQKAIGPQRLPFSFAWASMLSSNAKLVFSSDWPACIDVNPIRGIHVAVNRRTPEGFPEEGWIAGQKVSVADALIAYTRGGAFASFEEDQKGQIMAGQLADLVVLSEDLFVIDPMKIATARVVLTVFDGKVLFEEAAQPR